MVLALALGALGTTVAAGNVVFTRRVWNSDAFEHSQQVAQTILMWLVPGTFLLVRLALRDSTPGRSNDPTVGGGEGVPDWTTGSHWDSSFVGHHGGDFGGDGGVSGH